MDSSYYPLNGNILAPFWRLSTYTFPEFPAGRCPEKATYISPIITLGPDASSFNNLMQIDQASDFLWNEWRMGLVNIANTDGGILFPNVQVRLRDSLGRQITNDFIPIPQCLGMLMPLTCPRSTEIYIDAITDDAPGVVPAQILTITFQLLFRGFKVFNV